MERWGLLFQPRGQLTNAGFFPWLPCFKNDGRRKSGRPTREGEEYGAGLSGKSGEDPKEERLTTNPEDRIVLLPNMGNTNACDLRVRAVILCRVPSVEPRKLVS